MKYFIQLQKEGWYFAGFKGPSGKAEIGTIEEAKVYNSEREALGDLSRMGSYGQKIVTISHTGRFNRCLNRRNPGNLSQSAKEWSESEFADSWD